MTAAIADTAEAMELIAVQMLSIGYLLSDYITIITNSLKYSRGTRRAFSAREALSHAALAGIAFRHPDRLADIWNPQPRRPSAAAVSCTPALAELPSDRCASPQGSQPTETLARRFFVFIFSLRTSTLPGHATNPIYGREPGKTLPAPTWRV